MNPSLQFLLQDPDTLELMRELTPEELKTVELSAREYDLGGTHYVRVNGENFFSFEMWCGRIQNVKRLRAKPAPPPKPAAKKWEYKITQGLSEKQINELGEEGWELTAATEHRMEFQDAETVLYFKREKP